ncbi:Fic family protein [Pararhizobium sp. O133]|uniref:Fic family protein n=1 Tax=Pararhizobium sp. O133 TaxID=3449278 RepID=UPI003F684278
MFRLDATPYTLPASVEHEIKQKLDAVEDRVSLLRRKDVLTQKTLRAYYGEKRFEQVAESNAIEGSTLSAGETELAVLKGITITGHDPAFIRDAVALDRALNRVVEIAQGGSPTDIEQLLEIHGLLLGDRPGAGMFRSERVRIKGAQHTPPRTWGEVMAQMEVWQQWSVANADAPAPIRAAVLHAWLTHVHPFIDGNGRVSRAIGNLELIRAGYPPIIIKKVERDRYIDALGESDVGGDISGFIDLIFDRIDGALTGMERSAAKEQGYSPVVARLVRLQEQQMKIWNTGLSLLASMLEHNLTSSLEVVHGTCSLRQYGALTDVQDFASLCAGRSVSGTWAFSLFLEVPGFPRLEKLAWVGHRSGAMSRHVGEGGPSIYWSRRNPVGFPKWISHGSSSPFATEITSRLGHGDDWISLSAEGFKEMPTTAIAKNISDALLEQIG